ncbi:MAG TPA: MarR family transcriptional regulator [Bacteroidota bacterium]|nr:MarR family transcriptional regulator [Bacteroidota bacterium]
MKPSQSHTEAADVANLTFKLLASCQKKEERVARQFSLTVNEFRVLRAFRNSTTLHVKNLIDDIGLGGSSFSKIAGGLEEKGLLVRSIEPQDRRSVRVSLTARGVTLSQKLESRYVEIHEDILRGIPADLHPAVIRGLEQLFQSLDKWLHEES